jgi:hypothetical protein
VIRTVPLAAASRSSGGKAKLNPLPESTMACGMETETAPGTDPSADRVRDTSMPLLAAVSPAVALSLTVGKPFAAAEPPSGGGVIALPPLEPPLPAFVAADAPAAFVEAPVPAAFVVADVPAALLGLANSAK